MSMLRTIVMLSSDRPITGADGTHRKAIDGERIPPVLLVDDAASVHTAAFGEDIAVWIGDQVDELAIGGRPPGSGCAVAVGQSRRPATKRSSTPDDEQHVPGLAAAPGTVAGHRYRAVVGDRPTSPFTICAIRM